MYLLRLIADDESDGKIKLRSVKVVRSVCCSDVSSTVAGERSFFRTCGKILLALVGSSTAGPSPSSGRVL